jgi:hypothetical protein
MTGTPVGAAVRAAAEERSTGPASRYKSRIDI